MYIFVFDVDGTLTPSKKEMDTDFKHFFKSFCLKNKVYIVTGNDLDQTEDQLGPDLIKTCEGIFTCGGNEYYSDGKKIYSNRFELTYHEKDIIETLLHRSFFTTRTGYHFEKKTGLVNFSVLGRNATNKQREEYIEWDKMCLLINGDEIESIPEKVDALLESGQYQNMIDYAQDMYEKHLTWDGCLNTIAKIVC
mgnify:CR=1 FL=1